MTETVELAKIDAHLYLAALTHAAKDDIRWYLNGVNIESAEGGGAVLVATDGHRAIILHDANGQCAEQIILPAMKFAYIKLTGKREPRWLRVVRTGKDVSVVVTDEEGKELLTMPVSLIEGNYPDWRAIVPALGDVSESSWNPDYLSDLGVVSKAFDKTCYPKLVSGGGEKTTMFAFNAPAFIVIMPIRDENLADELPAWIQRQES